MDAVNWTDADRSALCDIAYELSAPSRRRLRRILIAHRDEAADYLSDAILLAVLPPADRWWLRDMEAEALRAAAESPIT